MSPIPAVRASKSSRIKTPPDLNQLIDVTVLVRSRTPDRQRAADLTRLAQQRPGDRKYLTPAGVDRVHGASSPNLKAVEHFARQHDLTVKERNVSRGLVVLSGTLKAFENAFKIRFTSHVVDGLTYRTHTGSAQLPRALRPVVHSILGLDSNPQFSRARAALIHVHSQGLDPRRVAEFYNFPPDVDGTGQTIALIELGGGFNFSDIETYCDRLKIRKPRIRVVEIDGQKNAPVSKDVLKDFLRRMRGGKPQASDAITMNTIEATMDVQIAASIANGADIVVYFAPATTAGKYKAWSEALHDTRHRTTVISCSWSAHEDSPTLSADSIEAMEGLFQRAVRQGVTVCCSSGDDGDNVHYPASSPWVLACGGTHLHREGSRLHESYWKEPLFDFVCSSSGGASGIFKLPHWQKDFEIEKAAGHAGRGVPDVAAKADIRGGYRVIVGGQTFSMGGTSAATPLWAGLVARLNQKLGVQLGYVNPMLYLPEMLDATVAISAKGSKSRQRWRVGTGLGSPRGDLLVSALSRKRKSR
jgi:kumamolisin